MRLKPTIVEIAREAFELTNEVEAERRLRIFLRALADTVIEGASDPPFSQRLHPVGTFKTESRPSRNRINPARESCSLLRNKPG